MLRTTPLAGAFTTMSLFGVSEEWHPVTKRTAIATASRAIEELTTIGLFT
jgi:hypothetical protein